MNDPVSLIVLSIFFQTLLTFTVMIIMGKRRFHAAKNNQLDKAVFKTMNLAGAPDEVVVAGRNFTNQFEIPVLFFVVCIIALITGQASWLFAVCSALFVISRIFHSYIHLTTNNVMVRYRLFLIGCLLIIIQWATIITTFL